MNFSYVLTYDLYIYGEYYSRNAIAISTTFKLDDSFLNIKIYDDLLKNISSDSGVLTTNIELDFRSISEVILK